MTIESLLEGFYLIHTSDEIFIVLNTWYASMSWKPFAQVTEGYKMLLNKSITLVI